MFWQYFTLGFEIAKMVAIYGAVLFAMFAGIAFFFGGANFEDKVRYPWEKEEKRKAKKQAKEEERARREFYK